MRRVKRFCERAIQRVRGDWAGNGCAGEDFADPGHVYAHDLNVFGEGSLFELLCIARSGVGRHGLASYLMEAPSLAETPARQQAIGELRQATALREKAASLGPFESSESSWETFDRWLDAPTVQFGATFRVIALVSSALLASLILAAMLGILPWIAAARWFYLPSLVLLLGTQLCMAIEGWRGHNRSALRSWLAAWAEFEALNSLACYAYENPGNVFPEVSEGDPHLKRRPSGIR
jgi:hypothetical protein